MRQTRDGMFHAWRASPSHTEEADERADRDHNAFGTLDPVRACPIEDEGTHSLRGIGACVIPESIKKPDKDSLIDIERCLSQASVFAHPKAEFSQNRPDVTGGWRSDWERKLSLVLEEPNEHGGGRHRMAIGSPVVTNVWLLLDCRPAGFEPRKEVLRGEPCAEHPIGPAGERAQQGVDRDWPVPLEVEPVSKGVDVISGGPHAESPSSDR